MALTYLSLGINNFKKYIVFCPFTRKFAIFYTQTLSKSKDKFATIIMCYPSFLQVFVKSYINWSNGQAC
jgi:predicted CDP-diglyceride synthetase/phosphatidate cytidylyltransferase